jgi:hypothetical protein
MSSWSRVSNGVRLNASVLIFGPMHGILHRLFLHLPLVGRSKRAAFRAGGRCQYVAPIVVTLALLMIAPPAFAGPFGAWAGIIVAGDYRGHSGAPAEVFDNARRDLARRLVDVGFDPANVRQFSVRPGRYADMALRSDFAVITQTLKQITQTARGGCFLYFTSHGNPDGIVVGDHLVPPRFVAGLLEEACPNRPAVIIVSACYSGVFIPALADENRVILTAARPDRSSFGCSEDLDYTFFDQCVLQAFPLSATFPDLAVNARDCVASREQQEGLTPPSEPQLFIGDRIDPLLAYYTLATPAPLPPPPPPPLPSAPAQELPAPVTP